MSDQMDEKLRVFAAQRNAAHAANERSKKENEEIFNFFKKEIALEGLTEAVARFAKQNLQAKFENQERGQLVCEWIFRLGESGEDNSFAYGLKLELRETGVSLWKGKYEGWVTPNGSALKMTYSQFPGSAQNIKNIGKMDVVADIVDEFGKSLNKNR